MNKRHYKVIFSRVLNQLVVVSELAKSQGKATSENLENAETKTTSNSTALSCVLKPIHFSLMLALGFVYLAPSAHANPDMAIRADKSAPVNQQATVLQTANGLPQVNIQTPSAGGVSRNQYSQFDVAEKGAILNNARKAAQTQMAGWVQGNPNLAGGEAKVILNEVNSANPSRLKGYVEVAGQKADVVIANPSGIHCEGCGVINAGRATMTTGKAQLENGNLKGFEVKGGQVTVSGKGMDNSQSDYTDIIAEKVKVDAGIWSKKSIQVTTGKNNVNRTNDAVVYVGDKNTAENDRTSDTPSTEQNQTYAVDVSQLGGMYAERIQLVDNGSGLGVRNAGHIGASAGNVQIDSQGRIVNQGHIQAAHDVKLNAKGGELTNTKNASIIAREGGVNAKAKGEIKQDGQILAKQKVELKSASLTQSSSGEIVGGNVRVETSGKTVNRGLINSRRADESDNSAKTVIKSREIQNIGTGRIYGDKVALGATLVQNLDEKDESGNLSSAVIAGRKSLALGAKRVLNQSRFYTGNTDDSVAMLSFGTFSIGGALDDNDELTGKAERVENRSALMQGKGGEWRVAQLEQTNDFFATEVKQLSDDNVDWHYIVPDGESEQSFHLDMSLIEWYNSVRGKNGYRLRSLSSDIQKPKNGDVISSLLPPVTLCQDANCEISPETYYLPNDPAWQAFGLYTQQRNNVKALLENAKVPVAPVKPQAPANLATQDEATKSAYEAKLKDYEQALKAYQIEKATFDEKIKPIYVQWMKDNATQFEALSEAIHQHNSAIMRYAGGNIERYWVTNVNRAVTRATVVTKTQPGKILMDGDLTIDADTLTNDKSQIILGGALHLLNAKVNNLNADGVQYRELYGDKKFSYLHKRKSKTPGGRNKYDRRDSGYTQGLLSQDVKHITLPVANVFTHYQFNVDELASEDNKGVNVTTSSRYKINPASDKHVLVETDPNFTDRRKWLSSDYMFNMLRADPQTMLKRLGDGYYEQQLVRNQINQLTGRMYLGNYGDLESQYKALMNNAVTVAQQFHLTPGVALSAEQVKSLTSDIVWFEPQTVTLKDGSQQTVLAPKVYLSSLNQNDIDGEGTLISAEKVVIQGSQGVNNQAQIAGRELTLIEGNAIHNEGKISGKQTALFAQEEMTGSGHFEAENALVLNAQNITLNSTTSTGEVNRGDYSNHTTQIDRQATLYVKGENGSLTVAAENIVLNAVNIMNEGKGKTQLQATNNLTLGSVTTSNEQRLGGNSNHRKHEKKTNAQVSRVYGEGDVVLHAKNLHTQGGELQSKGALNLSASENLTLGTKTDTAALEEYHKDKTKRIHGAESKESYLNTQSETQQGTRLGGQSITVTSGKDLTAVATQVLATQDILLSAGGKLNVDAAVNREQRTEWEKHKKSGITGGYSGGVARVGYESNKLDNNATRTSEIHQVAQFASEKGNVHFTSGDALTLNAATLNGQDIVLDGSDVKLNAVIDKTDSEQHTKQRSFGAGVRVTVDSHSLKKQEYRQESANGSSHTLVGKWLNLSEAVDKANHQMLNFVAGYGHGQKSESHHSEHHETAQVNDINAKGNLRIQARDKSITAEGGQFNAGGDVTLTAKENVTLGVAETLQSSANQSRRRGFNVDGSQRWDGMVGVYHDKSHGDSTQVTQQGALITAGGKTQLDAQTGDITLKGATVVSEGDTHLQAGKDIHLTTAVNRQSSGDESTKRGVGSARISDTERFYGYQRELGSHQQDIEQHQGSQLTSLTGNVTAVAQGNYQQTSSELLAKEKINVSASSIKMDNALNSQSMHSHESDLKIGNFTRVKSPIIDLLNTLESAVKNKDASDRVKAANLMSLAAQGYNLNELTFDPSQWKMDKNPMDEGYVFRVESGAGFSHKRDNREGFEKTSVANRLNAKDITLTAHHGKIDLTHTDLTSRDKSGSRIKDSHITLNAKDGIDYLGGEDLRYYKGRQQSSGVEVGTAFSVGAKMGWSFYVQAGFNQGKQDREGQLVQNSQVDTERFQINTGSHTDPSGQAATTHQAHANLSAVTAKAKTITTNIDGNLNIESRQSHEKERVKNSGAGIQLEGGFGTSWNASVNGNASKGNSERHQVIEQAGLFAEEGGYHINADNVHLKGAAIASTNPNNSELTTNKLTFEDIENHSSSKAMSASMSAGYGKKEGEANPQYSPGLPMAEKESDRTITKATLTEGKIILNKETTPTETTVAALGINTDITQANAQTETPKDINKTLNEQQQIAQAVGHVKSAVENYVKNQRKAAEEEIAELEKQQAEAKAKGDTAQVNKLESQLDTAKQRKEDWGTSGANKRIADTVTGILTTALAGAPTEALATTAVSPLVNQAIKKATTNEKGEVDKIPNAIAHAVWGAIEAASMKGNATAGAVAAASSELAAPLIAEALYGTADPKILTEEQKQNIVKLSSLAGAIGAGIASGNSNGAEILTSANQGGEIGKRAVENNALEHVDIKSAYQRLLDGDDIAVVLKDLKNTSQKKRAELLADCDIVCREMVPGLLVAANDFSEEQAIALGSILSKIPAEQRSQIDMLVQSENNETIEAIENSKNDVERHLALAVKVVRFFQAENAVSGGKPNKSKAVRAQSEQKDYSKDNKNIGRNNKKFNESLNNSINLKPDAIRAKKVSDRVNEIALNFNSKQIEPKDMKLTINGQTYLTNPKTSTGVPVYKNVPDKDVISYFKEISGVDKLPNPVLVSKIKDLNGDPGKVWSIKPVDGPLKGSTVNLRTFSTSQHESNAKFTIEILKPNKELSGLKRNVEIKFEK